MLIYDSRLNKGSCFISELRTYLAWHCQQQFYHISQPEIDTQRNQLVHILSFRQITHMATKQIYDKLQVTSVNHRQHCSTFWYRSTRRFVAFLGQAVFQSTDVNLLQPPRSD